VRIYEVRARAVSTGMRRYQSFAASEIEGGPTRISKLMAF